MCYCPIKELSAKKHLELAMEERCDFTVGKAHCHLASLYPDYDPVVTDITELQYHLKWNRPSEAALIMERLVKTHSSDDGWAVIYQLFLRASSSDDSNEKELFTEISSDTFEFIIGGITKRFDNDDFLKTKMLLFCLRNADENRFGKLLNRAVTFLTERACNDKELEHGVGKYHLYLAVIAAPALLKLNFTNIAASRALSVVITVLHVGIAWPEYNDNWTDSLRAMSESYAIEAQKFKQDRFKVAATLFDKCIALYDLGTPINLLNNMSSCSTLTGVVEKACSLKSEARKVALPFFIWFAYKQWKMIKNDDEVLIWVPEDNWAMDVDKLLNSSADMVSPSKRPRLKDRKEQPITCYTEYLMATQREMCDAYELCCAAVCRFMTSISVAAVTESLYFSPFYNDVQQLITDSLLFKCKVNETVSYIEDQLENDIGAPKDVLLFQSACANCLDRSWSDACENVIGIFSITTIGIEAKTEAFSSEEEPSSVSKCNISTRPAFIIVKRKQLRRILYDIAYHVLYRVYTSTAMDHDNDQLLGALLVLSQIDFPTTGYRCFNRIMRHVEAKGSLKSAGLVKYISNIAILEELSRIQDYCSEYVSIQIAVPQIQRRIGQSTRHSVRGTKDGQKQSLEEQIRKCHEVPEVTVSSYFTENREAILKMLGAKL